MADQNDSKPAEQAYDNTVARWNHREHEAEGATFDSVLAEELAG